MIDLNKVAEALELWYRMNKVADKVSFQPLTDAAEWDEFEMLMSEIASHKTVIWPIC